MKIKLTNQRTGRAQIYHVSYLLKICLLMAGGGHEPAQVRRAENFKKEVLRDNFLMVRNCTIEVLI